MIVCISGPSGVGKTSIARRLASHSAKPMRSCGDAVRARAKQVGLTVSAFPDRIHREIDDETVAWAISERCCIVEGRFLDAVFRSVQQPWLLVALRAPPEIRAERIAHRQNSTFSMAELMLVDAEDARFRSRIYGGKLVDPWLTVDSGYQGIEELAECIEKALSDVNRPT